jgi:hypothetical protein
MAEPAPPRWLESLRRIVGHPLTQLGVALVLIVTSAIELSQTFVDDFYSTRVRATHGLLIVGIWQMLRTLPDLIEGIERYLESHERPDS